MLRYLKPPHARGVIVLMGVLLCGFAASAGAASARVLTVTHRHVSYPHYPSIQAAVDAAHPGDWILIDRGMYVGPVRIATPRLHLRGIDRTVYSVHFRSKFNARGARR